MLDANQLSLVYVCLTVRTVFEPHTSHTNKIQGTHKLGKGLLGSQILEVVRWAY